jgi:hypothetical protein
MTKMEEDKILTPEDILEVLVTSGQLKPELEPAPDELLKNEIDETLAQEKSRNAPDLSALQDAVVLETSGTCTFLAEPGEKITIERWMTCPDGRKIWLDTDTYKLVAVNRETGDLTLLNEGVRNHARSNYITGIARGYKFKLTDAKGMVGKRRRGRPKKHHWEFDEPTKTEQPLGEKKKRGRPKGSKNRDRSEISADKDARNKKRAEKFEKRKARAKKTGR